MVDVNILDYERYRVNPDDTFEDIDLDEEVVIMDGQRFTESDAQALAEMIVRNQKSQAGSATADDARRAQLEVVRSKMRQLQAIERKLVNA